MKSIDNTSENSAFNFEVPTCKITISAPGWASVLCGVGEEKHKLIDNNTVEGDKATPVSVPSIFSYLQAAKPGIYYFHKDLYPIKKLKEQ